jgi:hypothetical protein
MHITARRISMVSILERRALLRNLDGNRKRHRRNDIDVIAYGRSKDRNAEA